MLCRLPTELVREIISQTLYQGIPADSRVGTTSKPSWVSISPLVSASRSFRILTLEQWFRRLYVTNPLDLLEENLMFKEIRDTWTRELHCVQRFPGQHNLPTWTTQGFKKLEYLRFDWVNPIPDDQSFRPNHHGIPSTITELDVRGMEWPSPKVLQSFSVCFPALEILRLEQDSVWCGLCNLCCLPTFQEPSPTLISYEGGTGLSVHYTHALATLKHLREVYISVGCGSQGSTRLDSGSQGNENLWSGECDECMVGLYSDEKFRREWVAKKRDCLPRPPRLDKVEWNFYTTLQGPSPPSYLSVYDSDSEPTSEV